MGSAHMWRRFHLAALIAWVVVGGIITYFNPDSILWVAFMSLYANVVGHWSAYQASRTEDNQKEITV